MFDRIISVDWSGAGSELEGVDLRIAHFDARQNIETIVDRPYQKRTVANWSRSSFRDWIVTQLTDKQAAIVAMDFGFGLPWGAERALFGVVGWREMVRKIAERYVENGTSRATAQSINDEEKFGGHGPYRFDDNRNDFRFYRDEDVGYYRLTELIAPQGISQWYLGSGGTVGFHTISGLAAINFLFEKREQGEIDFEIWPHETLVPSGHKHLFVESYPSVCPRLNDYGPCKDNDQNQKDAWKVLQMLIAHRNAGTMSTLFQIQEQTFGRVLDVSFKDQIQFEGFILGLNGNDR